MRGLTFDTGALIALERRSGRMPKVFATATHNGMRITVPAAVVAEWWRGAGHGRSALLGAVDVEPLDTEIAKAAGEALGKVGSGPSVVDAIVMASAARRGDVVYTADVGDLSALTMVFGSVKVLGV